MKTNDKLISGSRVSIGVAALALMGATIDAKAGWRPEGIPQGKETHGGSGVVCESVVQMLDVYEGVNEIGLDIPVGSTEPEGIHLHIALARLSFSPEFQSQIRAAINRLKREARQVGRGDSGWWTKDYTSLLLPENCRRVHLGIYNAGKKRLEVNRALLSRMTGLNRDAFWLHEGIYQVFRDRRNEMSSDPVRILTAYLLAATEDRQIILKLTNDPAYRHPRQSRKDHEIHAQVRKALTVTQADLRGSKTELAGSIVLDPGSSASPEVNVFLDLKKREAAGNLCFWAGIAVIPPGESPTGVKVLEMPTGTGERDGSDFRPCRAGSPLQFAAFGLGEDRSRLLESTLMIKVAYASLYSSSASIQVAFDFFHGEGDLEGYRPIAGGLPGLNGRGFLPKRSDGARVLPVLSFVQPLNSGSGALLTKSYFFRFKESK